MSDAALTTVDGSSHLAGGRCPACDTRTFPQAPSCPRCGADTTTEPLPTTGSIWSWTVQRIRPKPPYAGPEEFEPYAVAYVDFGRIKVEGPLFGGAVDGWSIGQQVRLVAGEPGDHRPYWFQAADQAVAS